MSNDIFGEFVDWWISVNKVKKSTDFDIALNQSILALGIRNSDETILSRKIVDDWHEDSEETYISIAELNLEGPKEVRTVYVAGYAITTPPGISIEERIQSWKNNSTTLKSFGIPIPNWYLDWRGTIYMYYPYFSFIDYVNNHILDNFEIEDFAKELKGIIIGLANLQRIVLSFPYRIRTNGLKLYYCGLGFDLGDKTSIKPNELIKTYEEEIFSKLPMNFFDKYNNQKQ